VQTVSPGVAVGTVGLDGGIQVNGWAFAALVFEPSRPGPTNRSQHLQPTRKFALERSPRDETGILFSMQTEKFA